MGPRKAKKAQAAPVRMVPVFLVEGDEEGRQVLAEEPGAYLPARGLPYDARALLLGAFLGLEPGEALVVRQARATPGTKPRGLVLFSDQIVLCRLQFLLMAGELAGFFELCPGSEDWWAATEDHPVVAELVRRPFLLPPLALAGARVR